MGPGVRRAHHRLLPRLQVRADALGDRPQLHHLRHDEAAAVGRSRELREHRPRSHLPRGAPEHSRLHRRFDGPHHPRGTRARAGDQHAGAGAACVHERDVPHQHHADPRRVPGLAVPLPPPRPRESAPAPPGVRADRLADGLDAGHARHHPGHGVALRPVLHGGLPGRAPDHPDRVLRGGRDRRRQRAPPLPPPHAAPADAGDVLRRRGGRAPLRAHLPHAFHHHRGRSRQRDARALHAHLRDRLLVHEDGARGGDLRGPLRDRDGLDGHPDEALHARRGGLRVRRRAAVSAALAWAGLLPLAALTFLFVLPIIWMATTSFQAGEKMFKLTSDYVEAARIDGAGELRILWSIVIPQCRAGLAVLALFSFRDSWDQFLWPLVVVSRDEFRTYPLGLVRFGDDYGNPPTEQMAIAVLATIPVFLLFLVLQRALRKGFDLSALKG